MSATGEVEITAVEQPAAEKPAEEKKPKLRKPRTHKTVSHPPYFQMIKDALMASKEKSGSSPYAIAKFMEQKFSSVLPANFRKILGVQLKNSVAKGKLIKIKASYQLSETDQTKPKSKPSTEKGTKRKSESEKKAAKKVAPKRTRKSAPAKPKQPKSIRSSAAKKAKKPTA
ncbi:histone H1-like [Actinidia eriantha]|uniref:histone H1-like n=1 Tax=Actinidia eriantha TaxID=165200 RepID=UPI002585A066|nr:histone H1-like [Actinidia eriantha]